MADDGYEVIGPEKVKSKVDFIPPPPCPQVMAEAQSPLPPQPPFAQPPPPQNAAQPPPPQNAAQPPPPAAAAAQTPAAARTPSHAQSVMSETSRKESETTTKRSTLKSKKKESNIDTGDGTGAHQRPNSCDTIQLSLTCVVLIVVLAVSIPVILTAFGQLDIEDLTKKLEQTK